MVALTSSCGVVFSLLQPLPPLKPIVCFSSGFMSYKLLYSDFILWTTVLQSPWLIQWGWFFGALPTILVSFVPAVSHCSTSLGALWSSIWAHLSSCPQQTHSTQRTSAHYVWSCSKWSGYGQNEGFKMQLSQMETVFYWSHKASGFLSVPDSVCGSKCWGNCNSSKRFHWRKGRQRLCFNILHSNYYSCTLRET